MFILIPTCDGYVRIAEIGVGLLDRYWPGHPPVHVVHGSVRPRIADAMLHRAADPHWLAGVTGFLRSRSEDQFLLLLDDYALAGPPRREVIKAGEDLVANEADVGIVPLCWYPASRRTPRARWPGFETLAGTPVLLQAAVWRRRWFLELAGAMPANTSAWGFELMATRPARGSKFQIVGVAMATPAGTGGRLIDGLDKRDWPLPYHNLMHRGRFDERHADFLVNEGFMMARGLGDTIADFTRRTGLAAAVHAFERVTGRSCGCEQRRQTLNEQFRYRSTHDVPTSQPLV